MVALLDAHRDQRAREGIDVVAEFFVGAGVVELRVAEARLIRELLDHLVEDIREGEVDERLLRPDVFAGACAVLLQRGFCGTPVEVVAHIVCKAREHHAGIGKLARPALDPLERHVAVVADAEQGVKHFLERQVAVAHQAVFEHAVLHGAVLHMDVADVVAEVRNGFLGRFAHVAVRMVHIPQRGNALAVDGVEQLSEAFCIGVNTVRFDQQRDTETLGDDAEHVQHVRNVIVVDLALRFGMEIGEHADIRCAELLREHDVLRDLDDVLVVAFLILQRTAGGKAGNFKPKLL